MQFLIFSRTPNFRSDKCHRFHWEDVVVEAISYKPEGSGIETLWDELIFFNLPNHSSSTRLWSFLSL
jgi:hypothetical protein